MGIGANLPNALTLMRLGLAPLIAWMLLERHDAAAFALFVVAAASDFLDGVLARRWGQQTRFGAMADPLADKVTGALTVLVLTYQGSLHPAFAAAVVARDLVIVGGALAYRAAVGQIEMAPSGISKLNTALLFLLLVGVLGSRTGLVSAGPWLQALQWATLATVVTSGAHYVVVWGLKAVQSRCPR